MVYAEQLPPHDDEAEHAVCGSLLIDGSAIAEVVGNLKPEHFYRAADRAVYEACLALYQQNAAIDVVTVWGQMQSMGAPCTHCGAAQRHHPNDHCRRYAAGDDVPRSYLSHLDGAVPTSTHIAWYAGRVIEAAKFRALITVGGEIAAMGYEGGEQADEAVRKAEEMLFGLHAERRGGLRPVREVADEYLEEQAVDLDDAMRRPRPIPTGFTDLDSALGRLSRGSLIILAARPGMGKTALATNIAQYAAVSHRVGYFSLEINAGQLVLRMLSAIGGIDHHLLRLGILSEAATHRTMNAIGEISDISLLIDDSPSRSLTDIKAECKRQSEPLDLVIVDHLQLMDPDGGSRSRGRLNDLTEITRGLKELARDLNVPVIALSQLNREIERRTDHHPLLSDLRESGSIEADADIVMFIHREDKYFSEEQWERTYGLGTPYPENLTQLIIAKNRHGPTQTVHLYARMQHSRFEALEMEHVEPPQRQMALEGESYG